MTKNPSVVGEGTYGCVHKPPMKCKHQDNIDDPSIASKLMKDLDAKKEMKEFELIQYVDANNYFHLGKPSICKADSTLGNKEAIVKCTKSNFKADLVSKYSLLLIKYGGLDLEKYGTKIKEMTMNVENRRHVEHFWMDISRIMFSLKVMNDSRIVHHDLKHQNIVYNQETGRANLIDFGLMTTKEKIQRASNRSIYDFGILHWSFPVEIELLNKNKFESVLQTRNTKEEYFSQVLNHVQLNHKYFFNCIIQPQPGTEDYKREMKSHITSFLQMLIMLKRSEYNEFVQKCMNTIDVYGTGIGLLYVLYRSKRFLSDEFFNDLKTLFLSMVQQNVFLRISPDDLIVQYEHLLLKHGLLEKYDMRFENHMLVEGRPIVADIAEDIKEAMNIDVSMTPKEQEAFIKSVVIQCPEGKEVNPMTKRCINKCKSGYARNDKFMCRKVSQNKQSKTKKKAKSAKKCPEGKEMNPKTNRCVKTCKRGYLRDAQFKCYKPKDK